MIAAVRQFKTGLPMYRFRTAVVRVRKGQGQSVSMERTLGLSTHPWNHWPLWGASAKAQSAVLLEMHIPVGWLTDAKPCSFFLPELEIAAAALQKEHFIKHLCLHLLLGFVMWIFQSKICHSPKPKISSSVNQLYSNRWQCWNLW